MDALRIGIAVASCCIALSAGAEEPTSWRTLHRDGSRQYDLGDFRRALDSFRRAYLAREDASILLEIADCHRQLGENADAVHAYQSYLRRKPDAANRADVEELIEKLQGTPPKVTAHAAPTPLTVASPSAPPAPPTASTPATPRPSVPAAAPEAPHGSVYNAWGSASSATPLPPSPPATETASTATPPTVATSAAPASAPPAWAPAGLEVAAPPRKKSRAWIAAIVVPAVAVFAVSIGVSAWYLSPTPTYTKVGPAQ